MRKVLYIILTWSAAQYAHHILCVLIYGTYYDGSETGDQS